MPDLVKAAIDHHSHGLVEYEAQAELVFLRGEAVVEDLHQGARAGCLNLGGVLLEEGVNVLADTHHGLQQARGLVQGVQQVPSVDTGQVPKEQDLKLLVRGRRILVPLTQQ